MNLTLSPVRGLPGQPETQISVAGETLSVDGVVHDLSMIPEGGRFVPDPGDHPFLGSIRRDGGVLRLTLRVCLDDRAMADQPQDPAHWTLIGAEGPVDLPIHRREEPSA